MSTVFTLVVVLHILFMAALVGGYFVALSQRGTINPVMVWGARLQLLTGVVLMSIAKAAERDVDQMTLGIKLVLAVGAVACCEIAGGAARRGESRPALVHAAGVLALVDFAIGIWLAEF